MIFFWESTWWIILFMVCVWLFRKYLNQKRKKKELEEHRRHLNNFFHSKIKYTKEAISEFDNYIDLKTGFFSNHQLTNWKKKYVSDFNELSAKSFAGIVNEDGISILNTFKEYFTNAESYRIGFNAKFKSYELDRYVKCFDNVDGTKLDDQQRKAIVTDEDNNIIIAGAGSGKTTTIVGKVNYVLDRYKTKPEEILLISFTDASARSLSGKLKIDGIVAKTFHKFGKDLIAEVDGKQPSVWDTNKFKPFINDTFNRLIKDKQYLQKVTEYFTDYHKPTKSQFEFENLGDYIQYLKDFNIKPYNLIQPTGRTTFHREIVKSIEECKIANFLLFHGISYKWRFRIM